jgi:hypothetical protein
MLPAPASILPDDAFPDEVTTRYEPQQEYWAYIQSLQSAPSSQPPRGAPVETEARRLPVKPPSVLAAQALGPASRQAFTRQTPAPSLAVQPTTLSQSPPVSTSFRATVPPPLPPRQSGPVSGPRPRTSSSSASVPPPHTGDSSPPQGLPRRSPSVAIQESGVTQTLVPIEVTQAILACCTDFLGPAARPILAGELRRLGVTPQSIPWSLIPGLISGISAHLDTARAVHTFSRSVQFCHPSLGSYWERSSRS